MDSQQRFLDENLKAVLPINKQSHYTTMTKTITGAALLAAIILLLSVSIIVSLNMENPEPSAARQYTYEVVNTFPHDQHAFTEGLFYADGFLYEGTGLNGASTLRRVDLASGEVLQEVSLSYQYFGEGIALVNGTIIQLTYQTHIGFIYDRNSFALQGNFSYPTQGWGLTFDGEHLIMSDGTDNLYFLDPETHQKTSQIQVQDGNTSVSKLNELEYVNGDIFANIFEEPKIAVINVQTGQIKSWIDLTGLQEAHGSTGTLNGIAYDPDSNRFFVTGKNWPQLFEIKLVPQSMQET
ncbi:MAG: glutaminyl-peptide cyclotransferase [Candidatus Bathyarchaeota archaeon]|nr:glutaminyl-peptide cyclotransferase [Candidatus Bathyarchaeota archaeon]